MKWKFKLLLDCVCVRSFTLKSGNTRLNVQLVKPPLYIDAFGLSAGASIRADTVRKTPLFYFALNFVYYRNKTTN